MSDNETEIELLSRLSSKASIAQPEDAETLQDVLIELINFLYAKEVNNE